METERVKEFIHEHSGLSISRISIVAKETFIALAKDQFCDDYGMTLQFLLERYDMEKILKEILAELYDHEKRINNIEKKPIKKDIKTCDGGVIQNV